MRIAKIVKEILPACVGNAHAQIVARDSHLLKLARKTLVAEQIDTSIEASLRSIAVVAMHDPQHCCNATCIKLTDVIDSAFLLCMDM